MLPFASAAITQAPATSPVTPPVNRFSQTSQSAATEKSSTAVHQAINPADKNKIGRLFGSINRIKNVSAPNQTAQTTKRDTAYTETQFEEVWFKFIQEIPTYPDLHFLFYKTPVKNNHTIEITVDNKVVYNKINSIQHQLLTYLSNQLNNDSFSLSIKITEQTKIPTTPREKARAMNKSNGNLSKLFVAWKLEL